MNNYKESNVEGTQYTRASRVVIENPLSGFGRAATFMEESVFTLAGKVTVLPAGGIVAALTEDNQNTTFPIYGSDGNQAGNATYAQAYQILAGLYLHVAQTRDAAEAAAELARLEPDSPAK